MPSSRPVQPGLRPIRTSVASASAARSRSHSSGTEQTSARGAAERSDGIDCTVRGCAWHSGAEFTCGAGRGKPTTRLARSPDPDLPDATHRSPGPLRVPGRLRRTPPSRPRGAGGRCRRRPKSSTPCRRPRRRSWRTRACGRATRARSSAAKPTGCGCRSSSCGWRCCGRIPPTCWCAASTARARRRGGSRARAWCTTSVRRSDPRKLELADFVLAVRDGRQPARRRGHAAADVARVRPHAGAVGDGAAGDLRRLGARRVPQRRPAAVHPGPRRGHAFPAPPSGPRRRSTPPSSATRTCAPASSAAPTAGSGSSWCGTGCRRADSCGYAPLAAR